MKKHTKRFMVIFSMWGKSLSDKKMRGLFNMQEYVHTETEFDTEEEWKEEVNLIEEIYADTPSPQLVHDVKWHDADWVFNVEDRFWGYMVLDFHKTKILKIGHDGIYHYNANISGPRWMNRIQTVTLRLLDELFRGDDEIPKDYNFDDGEYDGWLQFRWGDGKNAVKCDEPACKRPRKKKYGLHEQYNEDDYDELDNEIQAELIQDKFNAQMEKEEVVKKLEKW